MTQTGILHGFYSLWPRQCTAYILKMACCRSLWPALAIFKPDSRQLMLLVLFDRQQMISYWSSLAAVSTVHHF